jgi:hypothetical protein
MQIRRHPPRPTVLLVLRMGRAPEPSRPRISRRPELCVPVGGQRRWGGTRERPRGVGEVGV